ncbi:hypothetical protein CVT25_013133 [Psilocybe cyanescens]|uniref:Oxidation resistance protein 1 n=1 Tax=Psilocybe cyanescens TaxID=93625 RepID=A0A409XK01_PSICY|nr:hypothetical protein CVT25_013133 [Psilocybe cyanescens]
MSAFDELASLDPIQQRDTYLPPTPTTAKVLEQRQQESDSSLQMQHPHDRPDRKTRKQEEDFDKFATLFSPSTPRASPTLISLSLPDVGQNEDPPKSNAPRHHRTVSTSSQQSDFGAFVSVPAFEDPLSAGISSFEEEGLQTPMIATPTTATAKTHSVPDLPSGDMTQGGQPHVPNPHLHLARPSSRASSSSSRSKRDAGTSSLSFFDQFTQDARERSSTRSGVLDELLLHQDDPLYFLKDENPASTNPVPVSSPPAPKHLPDLPESSLPSEPALPLPTSHPSDSPLNLDINVNHDLDHDYFRTPPNPVNPNTSYKTAGARPPNPTRSSSIPMPAATLAPPVHSPEGAVRSSPQQSPTQSTKIISNQLTASPLFQEPNEDGILDRTPSYQSLSGSLSALPGKWMSNLLRAPPQAPGAKSTLESIFDPGDSNADPSAQALHPRLYSQDPVLHRRASTSPQSHRANQAQPPPTAPTFTHANAFTPPPTSSTMSVTHSASPFAPHTYIPPSGAPGFKGDSYTWDTGFSDELEAERKRDLRNVNQKAKTLPVAGKDSGGEGTGQEAASISSSKSGWGSGFGFSFGSGRIGKTNSGSSLSPSGSTTAFGPSSSSHNARSGSESSWDTGGKGTGWGSAKNASEGADYGRYDKGTVDPKRRSVPNADYGKGGKDHSVDQNGIGAFIERKVGKVELVGRKASTTPILSSDLAGMLQPSLPALSRIPRSWNLIYSLDQDGISLNTLYTRSEAHATRRPKAGEVMINNNAMLVVIQDADGAVFGAWLSEGIRMDRRGKGYYGGGESFLWKYTDGVLKIFKCTGKNHYVALCDPDYISFGGGDGHYGLYLDETLFDGSSAPCPTFDNEPLCSPGPRKGSTVTFECVGLEVWGLGS